MMIINTIATRRIDHKHDIACLRMGENRPGRLGAAMPPPTRPSFVREVMETSQAWHQTCMEKTLISRGRAASARGLVRHRTPLRLTLSSV